MKILFLLNSGNLLGGAEIVFLRLIKNLMKRNNLEITCINTEEGELNKNLKQLGLRVYTVPSIYLKRIYRVKELKQFFINIFLIRKIIKTEKPNLIHAFTLPLARRILFIKLLGIKIKVIGTIHDSLVAENFGFLKTKFYVFVINNFYNKLISVSNKTREIAIASGIKKSNITVIYNGFECSYENSYSNNEETEFLFPKDSFIIGTFGRITPLKGQLITLKAFFEAQIYRANMYCLIIGSPSLGIEGSKEYYDDVKQFILKTDLIHKVKLIEWTNEIEKYYKMLSVYILPSIHPDSFPTVTLEAMSLKIPIIASRVGGIPEQIVDGYNGFLVEPNDIGAFTEKIIKLHDDSELRKKMGENGYKKLKKDFTVGKWINFHLELYEDIITKHNKLI
ncbi:MAG: glycosyltransferase family 4 protein [Melioribacter sp.]|uniref:glycosyltransferase family 4 protein n=1 Tax=Melioribacter sp. TaxID=2052167 RepID=UPI003BCF5BA1